MRIAIVNDMVMAVEALRRVIVKEPQHQIAWVARDGAEAVRLCAQDKPDLVLMDLIMPVMDGVAATREIMACNPCAILLVTATMDSNTGMVFEALGAGALDAVKTPILSVNNSGIEATALLYKINLLAKLVSDSNKAQPAPLTPASGTRPGGEADKLVAIGASAGGPAAMAAILKALPADFPAAIIIIQHVDEQFAEGLAQWLGGDCCLPVSIAREGARPQVGQVLMAGRNDHLILTANRSLSYTPEPIDTAYRPSVDTFFESVARHWHGDATGILLTGMGRDGARGLKAMRDAGFYTVAQDQATSAVYGMPKAAAALRAARDILPLEQIAPAILKHLAMDNS